MRLIRMLSEAGIPTLDYLEYDSEENLTDEWQYISIAVKNKEVSVKSMTNRDEKMKHIEECRRIYGRDVKVYVADFVVNFQPVIIIVGEKSIEFLSECASDVKQEIMPIIDALKKVKGLPMPFSVFFGKDELNGGYKVTKFITIR